MPTYTPTTVDFTLDDDRRLRVASAIGAAA